MILEREKWPHWLKDADTTNAVVEGTTDWPIWINGVFSGGVFRGGVFSGGVFSGGEFSGGVFSGGVFSGGVFSGGVFSGGVFRGGVFSGGVFSGGWFSGGEFSGGVFSGGVFSGGVFRGGVFSGGVFRGGEFSGGVFSGGEFSGGVFSGGEFRGGCWKHPHIPDRQIFMASMIGIVFDADGYATAYRSTNANGSGRHIQSFKQPTGKYFDPDAKPAGNGTCCAGIHVASAATALTYFGIDPTSQLWRVKFHRRDLLDCDGQKARIRGGHFEKIPWPWAKQTKRAVKGKKARAAK